MAGIPETLKPLTPYMRLAKQFEARDPTVAYYCQMYVVQRGIMLDSKSPEGKSFLFKLMDSLENRKKELLDQGNDAVTNDTIASAYIETKGLQLFLFADREDRASNFDDWLLTQLNSAASTTNKLNQYKNSADHNAREPSRQLRYDLQPRRNRHLVGTAPGVYLCHQDMTHTTSFFRHASSALNFQDFKTCLENLTKAINTVRTGQEG
eukprot:sb/3470334/